MLWFQDFEYQLEDRVLVRFGSLSLDPGLYVLWGISGAGKTTLLELLGGRRIGAKGTVLTKEQTEYDLSKEKGREVFFDQQVSMHFQDPRLLGELNVKENLFLSHSVLKRRLVEESFLDEILKTLMIENYLHRDIGHLSRGEQQRVSLARAMIYDYPLLLLDEPLVYLQKDLVLEVFNLIEKHVKKTGKICILSSHDRSVLNSESLGGVLVCDEGFFGTLCTASELREKFLC